MGQDYELEYGADRLEMHVDAVAKGERILLVDDLIATGGTAEAAVKLIGDAGANIVECAFIIELPEARRAQAPGGARSLGVLAGRVRGALVDCYSSISPAPADMRSLSLWERVHGEGRGTSLASMLD